MQKDGDDDAKSKIKDKESNDIIQFQRRDLDFERQGMAFKMMSNLKVLTKASPKSPRHFSFQRRCLKSHIKWQNMKEQPCEYHLYLNPKYKSTEILTDYRFIDDNFTLLVCSSPIHGLP